WNITKDYLQNLQHKQIPTVPTLWEKSIQQGQLSAYFDILDSNEIILKPLVSAGADNTFWLDRAQAVNQQSIIEQTFNERSFLVQPFIPNILDEGEFSLFYFGG